MSEKKLPIDLLVTAVLAIVGAVVSLIDLQIPVLRAILTVPLILILPGFAFLSALFPRKPHSAAEQILLVGGISILLAGLVGIILDRTGLGLETSSWAVTLCAITLIACFVANIRQRRFALEPSVPHRLRLTWIQGGMLCLAGILAIGAVRISRTPISDLTEFQGYTVLWMLPSENSAPDTVRLGLISNEFEITKYELRLAVDNKTVHGWQDIQLKPGENWSISYELPMEFSGSPRVEAFLYKPDSPQHAVYRHVWVSLEP